ncbi:unnamed protein product, partial [marine sediment metagenome]
FVADKHNCSKCLDVCQAPGKAIYWRQVKTTSGKLRLPYVRQEDCVGCGACEFACPAEGGAGIRVVGGFRPLKSHSSLDL